MSDVYSLVLAGGVGSRLSILTEQRAKPAVPFGGKYRIIDFVLSNLANSGFFDVALVTQYRPLSLIEHVGTGRTWDLDRSLGGLQVLQPYLEAESGDWYQGTADAVYRNLTQIMQRPAEDVFILSGDHVYAMDYRPMLRFHRQNRFPVTVAVTPMGDRDPRQFGIVEVNAFDQVVGFEEKPEVPRGRLASMGVYVFRRDILVRALLEDGGDQTSGHDFGKDVLPKLIRMVDVGAYSFDGYWQDIGTVEAFYDANMLFLESEHRDRLTYRGWPIRTPSVEAPPARLAGTGRARMSLIANGAVVRGDVSGSILFPGVVVEEGAVVGRSIVMNGTRIAAGARVEHAVLDKRVTVGERGRVGGSPGAPPNSRVPDLLKGGVSLLGQDVVVEEGARVGGNVVIGGRRRVGRDGEIPDGGYLEGSIPRIFAARRTSTEP